MFTLSLVGIIIKFNNGTLYLFGYRADVVLSDSMSYKNPAHADFLEGHDNQIQRNDLVFSKSVESEKELDVYDIVLFNNPYVGTTMHRIVGKREISSDDVNLWLPKFTQVEGINSFQLADTSSYLQTTSLTFTSVEIEFYSLNEYNDNYYFVCKPQFSFKTQVESTKVGEYYKHVVKVTKSTAARSTFLMAHKKTFDYSSDYFTSIVFSGDMGTLEIKPEMFVEYEEGNYIVKNNTKYKYEIRGDAAENSDGEFLISDIYSKVTGVAPKLGMFIRFITSIYGVILLIGAGIMIIVVEIVLDKKFKSETQNEQK